MKKNYAFIVLLIIFAFITGCDMKGVPNEGTIKLIEGQEQVFSTSQEYSCDWFLEGVLVQQGISYKFAAKNLGRFLLTATSTEAKNTLKWTIYVNPMGIPETINAEVHPSNQEVSLSWSQVDDADDYTVKVVPSAFMEFDLAEDIRETSYTFLMQPNFEEYFEDVFPFIDLNMDYEYASQEFESMDKMLNAYWFSIRNIAYYRVRACNNKAGCGDPSDFVKVLMPFLPEQLHGVFWGAWQYPTVQVLYAILHPELEMSLPKTKEGPAGGVYGYKNTLNNPVIFYDNYTAGVEGTSKIYGYHYASHVRLDGELLLTEESEDTLVFTGDIVMNCYETSVDDSYQTANASVSMTLDTALFEVTDIDVVIDAP